MNPSTSTNPYTHHRLPAEIIRHGVWLYCRFCLSYRDGEERLFARGVIGTDEALRPWCRQFGHAYAHQLRCRRPRPGDQWHLDEVLLPINGVRHDLGRAVDQDGHVLDRLVQSRRHKKAAKPCFRKWLKGLTYVSRLIITDKLQSSAAATRESLPGGEHRQHRYLNNRAANSPNRHANASDACRGLSPQGTPNGSSPPMLRSSNTFDRAGLGFPLPSPVKHCGKDSRCGRRSRAQGWLPKGSIHPQRLRSHPSLLSRRDQHE